MYNVYLQAISPIFSTITLIFTYFWPRVVFQLKLWFWISISWSYLVGFAHTSILPSCPHVLSIFLLLIVTGNKKMQETLSWISLSNGLTTLTSTCPFHIYFWEIRINVEIFFTKTRRGEKQEKAKRQKQFSKKKLKSGKKSYQKNLKI
jgi:hypothetical protein